MTDNARPIVLLAWTFCPPGQPLGVDVIVSELPDGRFQLEWGDRVANSWAELYPTPDLAFARMAVLLRAVRFDEWFRHQATDVNVYLGDIGGDGPPAFIADASTFLTDQLTSTAESVRP